MSERWLSSISRRAREVARVPSKELGDRAEELARAGKDVLALKGAPHWPPPEHVLEAARRAAGENVNAPSAGFPELRRAIAASLAKEDGIAADPEREILVTNGAMHALSIVFTTLLDPGDEVVMFHPGFFFFGIVELAGGVPVYAETRQETGWRWDPDALERAISSRTKAILLSSPANPTGYVADLETLDGVAGVAARHDLLVVSDECYDRILYDGARHLRVASVPALEGRSVTVGSGTKSWVMQPWRVGYIIAPAPLTERFRNVLEWNVLSCSHVAQRAAQAVFEGPQEWLREIGARFERNRDTMIRALATARGISFVRPRGGPFLFVNTEGLGMTGAEASRILLEDYGVPCEAGALFGSERHIRLSFGGADDVVVEAGRRIAIATRAVVRAASP